MESSLYFLLFNNYFNRKYRKYNNLSEYPLPLITLHNCNFIHGDGVSAEHIITFSSNMYPKIDYMLEVQNGLIVSRWFVLEVERTSARQFRVKLRRDVIADYVNTFIDAPFFVQKGILNDSDSFIYNSENSDVNQIKKQEILLKDRTATPWIVVYYDRKNSAESSYMTHSFSDTTPYDISVDSTFDEWEYKKYIDDGLKAYTNNPQIQIYTTMGQDEYVYNLRRAGIKFKVSRSTCDYESNIGVRTKTDYSDQMYDVAKPMWNSLKNDIDIAFGIDKTAKSFFDNYLGKIIRFKKTADGDEYIYKSLRQVNESSKVIEKKVTSNLGSIYVNIQQIIAGVNEAVGGEVIYSDRVGIGAKEGRIIKGSLTTLYYTADDISIGNFSYNVTTSVNFTTDAPYNICAMPLNSIKIYSNSTLLVETTSDISMKTAMDMALTFSGSNGTLYDLQLLPYFPLQNLIKADGTIDVGSDTKAYSLIKSGEKNVGIIFNVSTSSFTFDINQAIYADNYKIASECELWRLCSPNFNGQFEFNVAKNGDVRYFNVDCTYKPYNPYIHVNPAFSKLYGQDFNDARGLICGGDFSLALANDAWATFERQNKNYQNIFDREIQSMDYKRKFERAENILGAFTGSLGGAVGGAVAGASFGPVGAIGGSVIGGVASAVGGVADVVHSDLLYKEGKSYKTDMYNFQLGNVKALPTSLSRTSAYTFNNKVFPIVEYYSSTEEEKRAIAQKIAYNSMNVNRIGTIKEFVLNSWWYEDIKSKGFIQGYFIFLDKISDDYNLAVELNDEVKRGVYWDEYSE